MGRRRVPLKKIERDDHRHISFSKRKDGLLKKAYEITTLCDVEIALIFFSPSGRLILFDGKRRAEETIIRYIDLPPQNVGRIPNHEMLRRLIDRMNMEADLNLHLLSSNDSDRQRRNVGSQLEIMEDLINSSHLELEEVENQLEYFLKSASCSKSLREIERHESILVEAMNRLSLRKNVLEAEINVERTLQLTLHPPNANDSKFIMESPNSDLGYPQQDTHTQSLITNLANPFTFRTLRDESEDVPEMLPSLMAFHDKTGDMAGKAVLSSDSDQLECSLAFRGSGYLAGNEVTGNFDELAPSLALNGVGYQTENAMRIGSDQFDVGLLCPPEHGRFSREELALGLNNIQQERTTPTAAAAGPSQVVNDEADEGNYGSSSFISLMT